MNGCRACRWSSCSFQRGLGLVEGCHSHSMVPGRLARDVEHHPVDLAHLVGDAGGDARQHVVRHAGPVGRHGVLAGHRAQHDRVAVRAAVALHAHRADVGEQHHGALPDLAVQARRGRAPRARSRRPARSMSSRSSVTSPMIRMPRPGPGNGWRQTISSGRPSSRPTWRTSSLNSVRNGSTSANCEVVGQAADVVVALDVRRAGAAAGLDDVGVERALHEELDRLAVGPGLGDDLAGRLLEDPDELAADDLALLLGVGDPGERVEEPLRASTTSSVDAGGGDEVPLDLLGLALAQQPVVDEDAGELVADRALHERGGDGGVDPAGQRRRAPACRRPAARIGRDLLVDDVGHRPGRAGAGDVVEEVLEHRLAVRRCAAPRGGTARRRACGRCPRTPRPGRRRVAAMTANPAGASSTESPWLIHTDWSAGRPRNSVHSASTTVEAVRPNSARPVARDRRRRARGPSPGSRSRCRTTGRRPRTAPGRRCGAPSAYTDDGPPDRMIAAGARPASPPPASCAARSRCRRAPRGPGGR